MNFFRSLFYKNLSQINYLVIFLFFIYAVFISRHHYDGHHIGLIYSNSLDLINSKLPYKEIYIQYGILTTLINSLILLIFDNKVFFITLFNSIFYSLGVLFISKTIRKFTDIKLALFSTVLILFNHPIPWLPWSNYIAFFFISLSLFLLSKDKKNYFIIGFLFGCSILSRQDFFYPIIFTFIFFCLIFFFQNNKFHLKNITFSIFGLLIPLSIFVIYLLSVNLFNYWIDYLFLPNIYLEIYETTVSNLIVEYIIFFISESFFSFIIIPQYFLISIILIFNTIIMFLFFFKKIKINKEILFILLIGSFLSAVSLKIELFRLYTSVIFGLIATLYFINQIKNSDLKRKLILLLLLPSIFSFCFYPMGNNSSFKKINFNVPNLNINNNNFDYLIIPEQKIKIINIINDLKKKCDVNFLENLTWDTMYSTVGNFDRIRAYPYASFKKFNFKKIDMIENIKNPNLSFIDLINNEIKLSNIILLITGNNDSYKKDKIDLGFNYNVIKIDENNVKGKPQILRIYFPNKCIL